MIDLTAVNPELNKVKDCLYRVTAKAIIERDGRYLIVNEADDHWWGFPGGGIDYGETCFEALQRELKEEINLSADHYSVEPMPCFVGVGLLDGIPRINLFYRVLLAAAVEPSVGEDVTEVAWVTKDELQKAPLSPTTEPQKTELLAIL